MSIRVRRPSEVLCFDKPLRIQPLNLWCEMVLRAELIVVYSLESHSVKPYFVSGPSLAPLTPLRRVCSCYGEDVDYSGEGGPYSVTEGGVPTTPKLEAHSTRMHFWLHYTACFVPLPVTLLFFFSRSCTVDLLFLSLSSSTVLSSSSKNRN